MDIEEQESFVRTKLNRALIAMDLGRYYQAKVELDLILPVIEKLIKEKRNGE